MAREMIDDEDNESPATGDDDRSVDTTTEDEPVTKVNGVR